MRLNIMAYAAALGSLLYVIVAAFAPWFDVIPNDSTDILTWGVCCILAWVWVDEMNSQGESIRAMKPSPRS